MRKPDPELQRRRAEEIAAAAARCFLARGFHQTSMQDIADAAGVSMGLLYRYFANKDAIIETAAELDRAAALAGIAEIAAAKDVVKALESFARVQIAASSEPGYVALVTEVAAEASRNKTIRNLVARDDAAIRAALVQALQTQRKAGRLKVVNIEAFVAAYLSLIDGLVYRAHLDPDLNVEASLAAFRPAIKAIAS